MAMRYIKEESLNRWLSAMLEGGRRVYAPVASGDKVDFRRIESPDVVSYGHIQTVQSAKTMAFPRAEKLFSYTKGADGVELQDYDTAAIPQYVAFGLRPCDAAGFASLSAIFNWGTADLPFNERRARTVIVTIACTQSDEYCFCTSVGGSPASRQGSDVMLLPAEGGYFVEAITGAGENIVAAHASLFEDADLGSKRETPIADVPVRFDTDALRQKLASAFESAVWKHQAERCLGCGACAFVCPACACFDIREEGGASAGNRIRCWDSCGFGLFTLHTSGHNPRHEQSQRWRQRVMHKFSYMPQRLSVVGCTGCGRCSRACPVDMSLAAHLSEI